MKNCKDLIKDESYRNWVKGTLGIEQTSKAVCEYVKSKFSMYLQGTATLYKPAIQSYLTADEFSHFRDEINSEFRYNLTKFVRLNNGKWYWKGNCQKCQSTLEKLICLHKTQKDIHWKNSDDTRTLSPEWAIAKIFMPMGNEKNKGPDDTDPSAIFIVMKMCDLFINPIRAGNINGVIDARNALFHSSNNLVEHGDLENYFTHMENLIADALNDPDIDVDLKRSIDESHNKIVKLKESEMTMTLFEDAQKAMRIKRTAIYYEFEQCLCENDPVQLKELLKLAEKLGSDLEFINNHFDEIKSQNLGTKELETLRKKSAKNDIQIRDLEDRLNKETMENKEKQEEISNNKDKIRKLEESGKEATRENDELQVEIANHQAKIREIEEKVNERIKENHKQQEEIANKNAIIRDLEEKIKGRIKENSHDSLEWETVAIASGLAVTTVVFLCLGL